MKVPITKAFALAKSFCHKSGEIAFTGVAPKPAQITTKVSQEPNFITPLYNELWPGEKKELVEGVAGVQEKRRPELSRFFRHSPILNSCTPELLSAYSAFSTSLFEPCASETTSPESRDCL